MYYLSKGKTLLTVYEFISHVHSTNTIIFRLFMVSIKANNHYYILWGNSLLIQCDIVERYKAKYLEYWHKYFMWYGYLYCPCISVVIVVIYSERHIFPLSENCDLTILGETNTFFWRGSFSSPNMSVQMNTWIPHEIIRLEHLMHWICIVR